MASPTRTRGTSSGSSAGPESASSRTPPSFHGSPARRAARRACWQRCRAGSKAALVPSFDGTAPPPYISLYLAISRYISLSDGTAPRAPPESSKSSSATLQHAHPLPTVAGGAATSQALEDSTLALLGVTKREVGVEQPRGGVGACGCGGQLGAAGGWRPRQGRGAPGGRDAQDSVTEQGHR